MLPYTVISADSHVVEPPDVYRSIDKKKYGAHRVPTVVRKIDAKGALYDAWCIDGKEYIKNVGVVNAGVRFEDKSKIADGALWENAPRGAYEPTAMLEALQQDGIGGAVVQATNTFFFYHWEDSEMIDVVCASFNDWMGEFCKVHPDRIKGIGAVNVDDIDIACRELERCARLGLSGSLIPVAPLPGRPYRDPMYEKLWQTAAALEMPLLMHIASHRAGMSAEIDAVWKSEPIWPAGMRPTQDYWVRYAMTDMIFAGVFTEDDIGVRCRDVIGVDNMMWGNDYPHSESTWPRSMQYLDKFLAGVPEEDRRKILHDNVSRIFKFTI
jgi:predicted TIM-barrel fold metal-dependent hydrolase